MNTPHCSAASMTSWPLAAGISRPLTVIVSSSSGIGGLGRSLVRRAGQLHGRGDRTADIRLELMTEPTHCAGNRRHRRGTERADRGLPRRPVDTGTDVVAHVEQQIDVLRSTFAVDDATK